LEETNRIMDAGQANKERALHACLDHPLIDFAIFYPTLESVAIRRRSNTAEGGRSEGA